jgi:hypothetical protein
MQSRLQMSQCRVGYEAVGDTVEQQHSVLTESICDDARYGAGFVHLESNSSITVVLLRSVQMH